MSTAQLCQSLFRSSLRISRRSASSGRYRRRACHPCRSLLRTSWSAGKNLSVATTRQVHTSSTGDTPSDGTLEACLRDLDRASLDFGISSAILPEPPKILRAYSQQPPERAAEEARERFGDVLPARYLNDEQLQSYERLYGAAVIVGNDDGSPGSTQLYDLAQNTSSGTSVLREGADGSLEEVEDFHESDLLEDAQEQGAVDMEEDVGDVLNSPELSRLRRSKQGRFFAMASKQELDSKILYADMTKADEASMIHIDDIWNKMDDTEQLMYLDDVRYLKLEHYLRDNDRDVEADELLQCLFIHFEAGAQLPMQADDLPASQHIERSVAEVSITDESTRDTAAIVDGENRRDEREEDFYMRRHPLTTKNQFVTSPTAVELPHETLTKPVSTLISGTPSVHLFEGSERIFGGAGLPYSTSNPRFAQTMPQKPIPLDPAQDGMTDLEADAYLAAVMPGTYASIMSVLVETRKRLGSTWLKGLMEKEGGPRVLDAGGAGAGVVALREVLRAEWEQMMDNSIDARTSTSVATTTGQEGGAPLTAPVGKATVLTGNATLRQRASTLLDDTTFVPRLPDYMHASDTSAARHGKFDIIFAPHALWSLKENYLRKQHVANLWSLLKADGGVLILLEKGVPRGFEVIAGARKFLLDTRVASPGSQTAMEELHGPDPPTLDGIRQKEKGMIIAPCTNHSACPMYTRPGISPGREDFCHFEQRYVRPAYLQRLLSAKHKNHEDVKFSYLSVMRGRDLRDADQDGLIQGDTATERAFAGFEHAGLVHAIGPVGDTRTGMELTSPRDAPHSLSLPRLILPPLKRTGHVLVDVCTPSATLERWIVPKSMSKQAFRDARKSSWGDLWALGAKSRTAKNLRLGKDSLKVTPTINLKGVTMSKKAKRALAEKGGKQRRGGTDVYEIPITPGQQPPSEVEMKAVNAGRMRRGKISGIRDKRDKSGSGRGRRRTALQD